MKNYKGFLIDPENRTITQVEYNGDYKQIYKFIKCETFTVVRLDEKNTIFVDDEGLLHDPRYFFKLKGYDQPLANRGLILGVDHEGESVSSTYELVDAKNLVEEFLELSVDGFDTKSYSDVEIYPGIRGGLVRTVPIFGPPKDRE